MALNLFDKAKEMFDEKAEELKKIKKAAEEKVDELKQRAGEKVDELKHHTEEKFDELKHRTENKMDEAHEQFDELKDKTKLETLIPEIRKVIFEKVLPHLNIKDIGKVIFEDKLILIIETTYNFLPAPARMLVSQESFVKFCMSNKAKIFGESLEVKPSVKKPEENKPATVAPNISAADELLKLKQLLDAGLISREEFDSQKKKLLNT